MMKKTHITELLETLRSGEYTHPKGAWDPMLEMSVNRSKGANMPKQDTRDVIFETEDLDGNSVVVTYVVPTEHFHPEMTEIQAEEVSIGYVTLTTAWKTTIKD